MNPVEKNRGSDFGNALNGTISIAAGLFFTQPFWTWKTLAQANHGMSLRHILGNEYTRYLKRGASPTKAKFFMARRLWSGYGPNAVSGGISEGINFAAYYRGAKLLSNSDGTLSKTDNLLISFFSGMLGSPINASMERGMIFRQLEPGHSFSFHMKRIVRIEGLPGLLKGTFPTFGRDGMFNLGVFALNDFTKEFISTYIDLPARRDIIAGIISGMIAGGLSNPFDLCKTRMQEDLKGEYPTFLKTMQKIIKDEGTIALATGMKSRVLACSGLICTASFLKERIPVYLNLY